MDAVDWNEAKFWLDVAQWAVTLGVMVFVWIDRGRGDNRNAIDAAHSKLRDQDKRLATMEEALRHVPTHEDISGLRSQTAALESKLDRVTTTLDRIHDYLMNKK